MEDHNQTRIEHNIEVLKMSYLKVELELWRLRQEIADAHLLLITGKRADCRGCDLCYGSVCGRHLSPSALQDFRDWAAEWNAAHAHMSAIRVNLDVLARYEMERYAHF